MPPERIRAVYDRRANHYDQTVGFGEKIALGALRREFGARLQGETLEVAVGTGLNLPYYSDQVTRAVGVDLSPGMLEVARERARRLGRAVELLEMDAQRLAFPDSSFDTVGISLALCTVPDPAMALDECARVCRPDGRLVLLEHVRSPVLPVAAMQRLLSPLQERFIGCSLVRETIDLARARGYEIVEERRRMAGVFRLVVARPPDSGRGDASGFAVSSVS
jgi:ubiquinone/menaquinone biosynthesis C-methylase UbiE